MARDFSIDEILDLLAANTKFMTTAQQNKIIFLGKQFEKPKKEEFYPSVIQNKPKKQPNNLDFDLISEAQKLHDIVETLRLTMTQNGAEVADIAKLVTVSTTLFNLILKHKKEVIHMDRLRKVEQATIEAVQDLEPRIKERFFENLYRLLED